MTSPDAGPGRGQADPKHSLITLLGSPVLWPQARICVGRGAGSIRSEIEALDSDKLRCTLLVAIPLEIVCAA